MHIGRVILGLLLVAGPMSALTDEIARAKAAESDLDRRLKKLESPAPIPTPTPGLIFEDTFDAGLAKWRTQDFIGPGQEATFAASQATVNAGVLSITAVRQSPNHWLSGCIVADTSRQLYGHFEARIKMPKGKGLWPAFWLLDKPFPPAGTPGVAELDIVELLANPIGTNGGNDAGYPISTIHWPTGQQSYGKRAVDLSLDYHVFAMDWRAAYVAFSLDGVEYGRFTDAAHIPSVALPVILNLAVGGWATPSDATTPSPSVMAVDFVRVAA